MTGQPRKRVRLLGVTVQPRIAIDDGEHLEELPIQATNVTPTDWPTYATTTFAEALAEFERQVNEPSPAEPPPNRATRRAAAKPGAKKKRAAATRRG